MFYSKDKISRISGVLPADGLERAPCGWGASVDSRDPRASGPPTRRYVGPAVAVLARDEHHDALTRGR
jgi:hypothetical protein